MKSKIYLISLLLLVSFTFSIVFASNTIHCWRQDISRSISPTLSFDKNFSVSAGKYDYIIPIGTTMTVTGLGSFNYYCDNGASHDATNFVAVYDKVLGRIIATNGNNQIGGPVSIGNNYCGYSGGICYRSGSTFIPDSGSCYDSDIPVGGGISPNITYTFDQNSAGDHNIEIRLGAISPANGSPITYTTQSRTIRIFVGNPSLIVFGQGDLKRFNFFENTGTATQELFFTIMNKSQLTAVISNYNVICSDGVNCTEPTGQDYRQYRISPGNSMVIAATAQVDKANNPSKFFAHLDLNYSVVGLAKCDMVHDNNFCSVASSPTEFREGLLDQQKFQIGVLNNIQQTNCIAADGTIGQTGESIAPRVNLSFGGELERDKLISIDECSPTEFDSETDNNNWVYCSQKEFLVMLAERIAKAAQARLDNNSLVEAKSLYFQAYLRKQSLESQSISSSTNIPQVPFQSLGLPILYQSYASSNLSTRYSNLINSIEFKKTIGGYDSMDNLLTAGLYSIRIDMNSLEVAQGNDSYIFNSNADTISPSIKFKVSFEKVSEPSFNWFFYDDNSDNFLEAFANFAQSPSVYNSNVLNRGEIIEFALNGNTVESQRFYKTYAVPFFIEIKDKDGNGLADNNFRTDGYLISEKSPDTFTYWTGFASSLGEGCETTSLTNINPNTLPYRMPDENIPFTGSITAFQIPDFNLVKPLSKIYFETVLYLPTDSTQKFQAPFNVYTKNGLVCSNNSAQCSVEFSKSMTQYVDQNLSAVFELIKNDSVCVSKESGFGKNKWVLFWNQKKILEDLTTAKSQITDANICLAREALLS